MMAGQKISPDSSANSRQQPAHGDHFVQFYEEDAFLVDSVGAFIGAGLGAGEGAIVIAEKSHREALEARLKEQGIDVALVRARRRLVLLDARDTLDKFMRDGMPVESLFREMVGEVVAWSLQGGRKLRAFGEMVALLWAEGNGAGAVRLEELWNDLGKTHVFSLFCAYPLAGFGNAADGEIFLRICKEHARVVPGESYPGGERSDRDPLREVALLQQKAEALHAEMAQRRRAESAGRHLAAIVESSDDAIISKDLNGVIASWNGAAERLFGYRAEEIIGHPISRLIPPQRLDEEPEILSRIRRGERIKHYETVRMRKDGTLIPISITVSPIRDGDGKVVGASKIARDITERKRNELALKEAREELEKRVEERTACLREAMAQMEEFSYTVSHDLRAPLRGMQTYSRALLEDYGDRLDADGRHYLRRISENARRLDRMILDVLTFSRVARTEIRMRRIPLEKLAREVAQTYPGMQPPHADILIDALEDVMGHESLLTQAVSNLMGNAVKFVPAGVTPKVRLRTERRDGQVRLWVEDNGIGIHPRHHGRLFDMFERIHPNLAYEGTGVGLAIVRKSVQRMGGEAGVESDGETGSRFWIQLPAAAEE